MMPGQFSEEEAMEKWQQEFASRVANLRESWTQQFEDIARNMLDPLFEKMAEFTRRCEMQASIVTEQTGLRLYKFALCEEAYVMLYFRPRGIDQIEGDYECFLPRVGKVNGVKSSSVATQADQKWAQQCFRMALDDLVTRFSEVRRESHEATLVLQ
jgi:hypothetical protein